MSKYLKGIAISLITAVCFSACNETDSSSDVIEAAATTTTQVTTTPPQTSDAEVTTTTEKVDLGDVAKAELIIRNAENVSDDYDSDTYLANKDTFLSKDDPAYNLIVQDLDEKTKSAQDQVYRFIDATENFFSFDHPLVNAAIPYYKYRFVDEKKAFGYELFSPEFTIGHYSDGVDIKYIDAVHYIPEFIGDNYKKNTSCTPSDLLNYMESKKSTDFSYLANESLTTTQDKTPFLESFFAVGLFGGGFENFYGKELTFSAKITDVDPSIRNYHTGKTTSSYSIPFIIEGTDISGFATFKEDNTLMVFYPKTN